MVVERTLESPEDGEFSVAYHGGRILVTDGADHWHVLVPGTAANNDVVIPRPPTPEELQYDILFKHSYVLESNGELLWMMIYVSDDDWKRLYDRTLSLVRSITMLVYALDKTSMRWVRRKHGQNLGNQVFFLGRPNSFAIDASRLDLRRDRRCAYFICYNYISGDRFQGRYCVIRYNLVIDTAEIIHWLPKPCATERCTWLVFQPTMAPMQVCTLSKTNHIEQCQIFYALVKV
jgi:hypothetical protein